MMADQTDLPGGGEKEEADEQESVRIQRRKILNRVVVGTGVAAAAPASSSWTRPVINTVVLPAHSRMTGPTTCYFILTQDPNPGGPMTGGGDMTTLEPPPITILVCEDFSN